jgi:hypothetical protein
MGDLPDFVLARVDVLLTINKEDVDRTAIPKFLLYFCRA